MVLSFNVTLSPETLVFVWISSADAANVTETGFPIIQAPSDYFYLDCGGGGWVGADPTSNSLGNPFKTRHLVYSSNPLEDLTTDAQKSLVTGGDALLWTEQSGPQNLDPDRLAARCFDRGDLLAGRGASGWFGWWEEDS